MSRTNYQHEMSTVPFPNIPDELEQTIHKFSPEPTIKGRTDALAFLHGELADPITGEKIAGYGGIKLFAITDAVEKREIEFFLFGKGVNFSPRGLLRWAYGQYHAPQTPKASA
jgi:hypothetical protein